MVEEIMFDGLFCYCFIEEYTANIQYLICFCILLLNPLRFITPRPPQNNNNNEDSLLYSIYWV